MVMGSDSHSKGHEIPPDSRGLDPAIHTAQAPREWI
jgi:hypothetical protein